jgi:hypothetical protein
MEKTEWDKLRLQRLKHKSILDVTAQRSVRQILGESGKTISNLDRDIVARIFGTCKHMDITSRAF